MLLHYICERDYSRSHDKSRHVTCHECGQVFHYPQSLKLHYERVHMGREGEQCPLCPRKFRYKCESLYNKQMINLD